MDGANASGGPWWVVFQASATPVCVAVWAAWRWWIDRGDKTHTESLSREERLVRDIEARQTSAATREADLFRRVSEELARRDAELQRKDARIGALEKESDMWMERARGWQRRAHAVVHRLNNTRFAINGLRSKYGEDELFFPDESLPPLEEIHASNDAYFHREAGGPPRAPQ